MATVRLFNHHIRTPFVFLILSEFVFLFLSIYIGFFLRFDFVNFQPEDIHNLPFKAVIFAFTMILGMVAMGQYQAPGTQGRHILPYTILRVSISLVLGTIGLVLVYYVFPDSLIGRGVTAYALAASVVGITILRVILFRIIDGNSLRKKILVLGIGKLAADIIQFDESTSETWNGVSIDNKNRALSPRYASYVIHGFVDTGDEEMKVPEMYIVKPGERLVAYCLEYEIDEIVVAIGDRRKKVPVDDLLDCKLTNIEVLEYMAFWEKEKGLLRTDMLNPSWLIFCDGCRQGTFESFMCRIFDVFASLLILSFMLPFLVITAFLIWVENRFSGPIFYRQERVGYNGRPFQLLKFRSMVVGAEIDGKAQWASRGDPRVTLIGRFIRKVRIDELPQMLNILKGDMSMVGPRPERPEFVEALSSKFPFYSTRHRVKPGLAGWAQLKYPYGADEQDANNKLQYDLYYVKNHSILMDMLILLQTVEVVLFGKGAR